MLRHLQTAGATSSFGRHGDSGLLLSESPLTAVCGQAHGCALVVTPLVHEVGSQTFEEVLSFSLCYPISGDDERRGVSAALPARLCILRLFRLCKAIQNNI